jgi:hypothetical protein
LFGYGERRYAIKEESTDQGQGCKEAIHLEIILSGAAEDLLGTMLSPTSVR